MVVIGDVNRMLPSSFYYWCKSLYCIMLGEDVEHQIFCSWGVNSVYIILGDLNLTLLMGDTCYGRLRGRKVNKVRSLLHNTQYINNMQGVCRRGQAIYEL